MEDTLVFGGGAAKSLDERQYLVLFSTANDPDASPQRNYFTKATDFGFGGKDRIETAIYYDHGKNPALKKTVIGRGIIGTDDVGVWIEGELDRRNRYVVGVKKLLAKGALGWSSGTAMHLIETKGAEFQGEVLKWPLGLDASLTPAPAEPRTRAIGLKSLGESRDLVEVFTENGIALEDEADATKSSVQPPHVATKSEPTAADPHEGLTLVEDTQRALDAVRGVNARWQEIARSGQDASDPAVKMGAKLTKSRRERVAEWQRTLEDLAKQAGALLAETEAKPADAVEESEASSVPTTASLRTQSLRLASQAAVLLHS